MPSGSVPTGGGRDMSPPATSSPASTPTAPSCPICLEPIEDLTYALACQHTFCYECINQWVHQRNRCPLCRQVVSKLRHRVPAEDGQGQVDREEEVTTPEQQRGFIIDLGFVTLLQSPMDSVVFLVQPVPMPQTRTFHYVVREFEPDHTFFIAGLPPGALWVVPENLERVTSILESHGITRIEPGIHQEADGLPMDPPHSTFLGRHRAHHRSNGHSGQQQP